MQEIKWNLLVEFICESSEIDIAGRAKQEETLG